MSEPSNWPLSQAAIRVTVPGHVLSELCEHPLAESCYTTAIGYYPQAKYHEMKRSQHDDFILIYCSEGKGFLTTKGHRLSVKAGDLFILPPNTVHAYRSDEVQPWTVYWCHFQGWQADKFFDYIYHEQESSLIKSMTNIDILQSFRELVSIVRDGTQLPDFVHASNFFRHILTKIERQTKKITKQVQGLSVSNIQYLMRANINKSLSLAELASLSHYSKYHFSREYSRITGKTPMSHFIELKVEHACFLLEQTNLSMSEIAFQLGYDDALYFSRVFRKVMGLAPSAYRKNLISAIA